MLILACGDHAAVDSKHHQPEDADQRNAAWFVDAAAGTGLDFTHVNGTTGDFYYPEVMAPGVALFDYDNDGDLDVFLVQGHTLGRTNEPATAERPSWRGRLYRNDLEIHADGSRTLRFTDVTEQSHLEAVEYGMGVAAGDYNNDGCVDLYVTALGRNHLYRNNCDGTFADVSSPAGVGDAGWSVSAAFLDFDRDGWLDLYVGHYLHWDPSANTPCFGASGKRVYCAPSVYLPEQSHLYHNNRDGTFTDVTATAGMATQFGPALGVTTADFNNDGWIDLYVANDGQENQLWINQHNGMFRNTALASGAAVSERGKAKAGMGVDAGDIDNDGDEDVFVANLAGEGHDLYVNDGAGLFESRSAASGLLSATLRSTGFGAAWFDYDNDGLLDLLVVNGAIQRIDALVRLNDPWPLRQPKQLFRNLGNGRFEDVSRRAGPAFTRLDVGRGAAFGDLDNDGDTDVVVANNNGAAELLLNQVGSRNHWLGLRLVGSNGRDLVGARVEVMGAGQSRWRRARTDGSYASANDARILVGLGPSTTAPDVRVTWPDGRVEQWRQLPIDRYTKLVEGTSR